MMMMMMVMVMMIIYLTSIGLTPGGNSAVDIYTGTIHRTTRDRIHRREHI
jgi:hypothetical protein